MGEGTLGVAGSIVHSHVIIFRAGSHWQIRRGLSLWWGDLIVGNGAGKYFFASPQPVDKRVGVVRRISVVITVLCDDGTSFALTQFLDIFRPVE